jgi:hypothetical protein
MQLSELSQTRQQTGDVQIKQVQRPQSDCELAEDEQCDQLCDGTG